MRGDTHRKKLHESWVGWLLISPLRAYWHILPQPLQTASTSQRHLSLAKFISTNICSEGKAERPVGNMVDIILEGKVKYFDRNVSDVTVALKLRRAYIAFHGWKRNNFHRNQTKQEWILCRTWRHPNEFIQYYAGIWGLDLLRLEWPSK